MGEIVRAIILVDSAEVPRLASEWGLSLLVEGAGGRTLLDFGQSGAFAANAEALGIDLSAVDRAVLSHAHYDHADGMPLFFAHNTHAPLYLSAACGECCWSTKGGTAKMHYIGVQPGILERYAGRLQRVSIDRVTEIGAGLWLVPHTTLGLKQRGERDGMWLLCGDEYVADGYAHEITLVAEAAGGLVVFSSCTHAGLDVVLGEVAQAFPSRRIEAFVGGLHLKHASDEAIRTVAEVARRYGVGHLWAGHCTGGHALDVLQAELPGKVSTLYSGLAIPFE